MILVFAWSNNFFHNITILQTILKVKQDERLMESLSG